MRRAAPDDDLTGEELARRRHDLWLLLRTEGLPVCGCGGAPLSARIIAGLFNVTPRAVRKGIAQARSTREQVHGVARPS